MKFILLLLTTCFTVNFWSQSIYGSFNSGFLVAGQKNQAPSFIVNSYYQSSDPGFARQEYLDFKYILQTSLNFGHKLKNNFAYELSCSYLKPFDVNEEVYSNTGLIDRNLSGSFFRTSVNVVINMPIRRVDLYSKLGLNLSFGRIQYNQSYQYTGSFPYNPNKGTLEYEYNGGFSLGFNGAFGLSTNINKRLSFFTEISLTHQQYSPSKGQVTEFTLNGIDELSNEALKPYNAEIEFVDPDEFELYEINKPQKRDKRNYTLGGYGLTIGIKFNLWLIKKSESVDN